MDNGPANSTVATGAQPVLTVTSVLNAAIAVASSDSHASMFLQLLCVLTTFGLSCAGGWLFCKYYFSGVSSLPCQTDMHTFNAVQAQSLVKSTVFWQCSNARSGLA